jgi:hypothetical protein
MSDERALEYILRLIDRRLSRPAEGESDRDVLLTARAVGHAARLQRLLFPVGPTAR